MLTYQLYYCQLQLITIERDSRAYTDIRLSMEETLQLYLDLVKYFSDDERTKELERYKLKNQACPF